MNPRKYIKRCYRVDIYMCVCVQAHVFYFFFFCRLWTFCQFLRYKRTNNLAAVDTNKRKIIKIYLVDVVSIAITTTIVIIFTLHGNKITLCRYPLLCAAQCFYHLNSVFGIVLLISVHFSLQQWKTNEIKNTASNPITITISPPSHTIAFFFVLVDGTCTHTKCNATIIGIIVKLKMHIPIQIKGGIRWTVAVFFLVCLFICLFVCKWFVSFFVLFH